VEEFFVKFLHEESIIICEDCFNHLRADLPANVTIRQGTHIRTLVFFFFFFFLCGLRDETMTQTVRDETMVDTT